MRNFIPTFGTGKQNLLLGILAIVQVVAGDRTSGQTVNWNAGSGDVWTRSGSWVGNSVPSITSIAVISGGSGTTLALREGTLAGGVSVGTLLLTNPTYTNIVTGASAASLNFDTTAAIGVGTSGAGTFTFGDSTNALLFNIGQNLRFDFAKSSTMKYQATVAGSGSVDVKNTATPFFSDKFDLVIDSMGDSLKSTFSGGMRADARVLLTANYDSTYAGGSVTTGPFGTATLTLVTDSDARCAAIQSTNGARTIHNPIRLETNSGTAVLLTAGTNNFTLEGPIYARNGSGTIQSVILAAGYTGVQFFNASASPHNLTLRGTVSADGWSNAVAIPASPNPLPSQVGTLVLAADNSSSLTGIGSVLYGGVVVTANGGLGSTGSSHAVFATMNIDDGAEGKGGQIRFVDGVNYSSSKELQVNGIGWDGNGVIQGGSGTNIFAGHIKILEDSYFGSDPTVGVDSGGTLVLSGTVEFTTGTTVQLKQIGAGRLRFLDTNFSSGSVADARLSNGGTVALQEFQITSGVTRTFNGSLGVPNVGGVHGPVQKTGTGTLVVNAVGVTALDVADGVLKIAQEGSTIFSGTLNSNLSVVNTLTIAGGSSPTAKLDLSNNELIIDYTGASPIGTIDFNNGTASGVAAQIRSAYLGNGTSQVGSWVGNGITSASANVGSYAIGYGEASALGLSTFRGESVDSTAVLTAFTYYGDANLNGQTNITDYGILAANWKTYQIWTGGDTNYDGFVDVADFSLQAANFNGSYIYRGGAGGSPLQELYIELLSWPEIYWDVRDTPEVWWRFAEFEGMGLGAIPPRPTQDRSVPEPTTALLLCATVLLRRRR